MKTFCQFFNFASLTQNGQICTVSPVNTHMKKSKVNKLYEQGFLSETVSRVGGWIRCTETLFNTKTCNCLANVPLIFHFSHIETGERKAKLGNPQINYNKLKGQEQLGKSVKLIFKTLEVICFERCNLTQWVEYDYIIRFCTRDMVNKYIWTSTRMWRKGKLKDEERRDAENPPAFIRVEEKPT